MSSVTVGELIEWGELEVSAIAGQTGTTRTITVPRIQKPGLALTGWPEQLHPNRVLVLGGTEIDYLADQPAARTVGIQTLMASEPACVLLCRGNTPRDELREACEHRGVPLLISRLITADFIVLVTSWLGDRLAPSV